MLKIDFNNISEHEFLEKFNTERNCLEYLAAKKWEHGFACKRCGNTNYCEGKTKFSRRCTRCKHDESAMVDTIFSGCRFDLSKAFYIAYTVCHSINDSTYELSRKLNLRQMTCWTFKKKLTECIRERVDISHEMKIEMEKILLQK